MMSSTHNQQKECDVFFMLSFHGCHIYRVPNEFVNDLKKLSIKK